MQLAILYIDSNPASRKIKKGKGEGRKKSQILSNAETNSAAQIKRLAAQDN